MQLTPFSILLRALLDQLQAKDQAKIFTQPVDITEVNLRRYPYTVQVLLLSSSTKNLAFFFPLDARNSPNNTTYLM